MQRYTEAAGEEEEERRGGGLCFARSFVLVQVDGYVDPRLQFLRSFYAGSIGRQKL